MASPTNFLSVFTLTVTCHYRIITTFICDGTTQTRTWYFWHLLPLIYARYRCY